MRTRLFALVLLLFLLGLLIGLDGFGLLRRSGLVASSMLAATPTLTLVAPPNPQVVNQTIDVQVRVSGATGLAAFEFDLLYDRSLVQVTGITASTALGATASCNPGATRCAVALGPLDQTSMTSVGTYSYGTGAGASGTLVLAVLHLQPTGAVGTTVLQMVNPLLTDVAANPLTPTTQNATLVLSRKSFLPIIKR